MASHWTLTVLDEKGSPDRVMALVEPSCHLGRDPENELQLDLDSVSGQHARLSRDPDGDWWIEDLNSTNGIWKDDEQLSGMHRISDGEVLEIGVVKVRFNRKDDDPEPVVPPPEPDQSHRIHIDEEGGASETESSPANEPTVIQTPGDSLHLDWDDEEQAKRAQAEARVPEQTDSSDESDSIKKKAPSEPPPSVEPRSAEADPSSEAEPESRPEPPSDPEPEPESEVESTSEGEVSPPPGVTAPVSRTPLTTAEKLERGLDLTLDGIGKVHSFLAHWLPILIGACVRIFCRLPIPARFCVGFGLMALTAALVGWVTLPEYFQRYEFSEEHMEFLTREGFVGLHQRLVQMMRYLTVLCGGAAVWAWVKRPRALFVFKAVLALQTLFWIYVFDFFTRVPSFLNGVDYKGYDKYIRNEHWVSSWTPWVLVMVIPLLLMLGTALRPVHVVYKRREEEAPRIGDQVLESLRTGGHDPRMRSSHYWASFIFFSVLAMPFLMMTCGWEEPYGLPQGSGDPVVQMQMVKKKKKKPQKRMIVNNWSPYIFERMSIDDIKVLQDLDEASMDVYEIAQQKSGKLGKGGGDKGGWPEGMEGSVVRFIRLKYSGGDWDQGMEEGSDINLLVRFNQITGFAIAKESEAKRASRLRRFPEGRKPPFVYLTGKRGLSFSSEEIKTLRWYTLDQGGMLFIDDGGPGFGRQVENLMRRLYPGNALVDIPNDDPIFQAPFVFPNGAPPLWQHSGSRARGIRHDGRWVVFFHPGDVGDAWVNNANEVKPEIAEQAYRLGINVMYYAFNMYYARHYE